MAEQSVDDGGKPARSPGSAKETVKTIARGMPGVSGVLAVINLRAYRIIFGSTVSFQQQLLGSSRV
jgi:hypothetical protein